MGTGFLRVNGEYDYEEEDVRLVYSELRKFIMLEYSRKIVGDFYLGLLYLGTKTDYRFDQGTDEENEFTEEFFKQNGIKDNFVLSLGINISFDNRDYPYYPTKGFSLSARPKFNTLWLGSENEYVDIDYKFAYYHSFKKNKILAMSIAGGFAFGDVPFDGYQSYGVRNNLRGYEAGKYKGRHMVAAQAEYRYRFYKKWGAVFFAGTGSVWSDEEEEGVFEKDWLPSVGTGLRFMVSKEKKNKYPLRLCVGY